MSYDYKSTAAIVTGTLKPGMNHTAMGPVFLLGGLQSHPRNSNGNQLEASPLESNQKSPESDFRVSIEADLLDALEYYCEASFRCGTIEGLKYLYQGLTKLGEGYPFLAGAIHSHLFMIKQEIVNSKSVNVSGFVYAAKYQNGLVKIGKTKNPNQRISALKGMSSSPVVEHYVSARMIDPWRLESLAHRHFKSHRTHGEFFSISMSEAIAFISENCTEQHPF